jgi:hypothetical protein
MATCISYSETVDRARLRWGAAIVAAVIVAEVAVVLLRPRSGVIEPARVSTESYFSANQVQRARDYRRPPLAIYGGVVAIELGVLALLVALGAAAAGMSLLAGADWNLARFGFGLWAGVAVTGFGLLGAFKAMLTLPVLTVETERGPAR